ncbi:MAG: 2-C-methyl-D-erythritol 4-phosphate cytidylyltransferase [Bacteroidales bacterium]|nr:2-C-methyl-D-erythritol 4-phosphate cytidylyltransferase [Bacteroidales bacterium]
MQNYVIIVAGGQGSRFKSEIPKQFINLNGLPVLMHTISAFFSYQNSIEIIVVLPKEQLKYWKSMCSDYQFHIKHQIVSGGSTRFYSVKNGLSLIKTEGVVGIHDGVRPLIDVETISRCYQLADKEGNAIPMVSPVDSMREILDDSSNIYTDRQKYCLIQTPQVFKTELILKAFEQEYNVSFTDDASVLEAIMPGAINLVEGNRQNIKITTPEDLIYAEAILNNRRMYDQ